MADIITCPQCQRRLTLPESYRGREVCCPSCRTTFSSAAGPSEAHDDIPFVIPVDVPPGWEGPRARIAAPATGERTETPRKKTGTSGWAIGLAVFVIVGGGLMVFGGILFLISNDTPSGRPRPGVVIDDAPQRQAVLDAFHAQEPVPDEQVVPELRPLLEALSRDLFFGRPGHALVDGFDADRMLDELISLEVLAEPAPGTHAHAVNAVRTRLGDLLQKQTIRPWEDFEVRNVKKRDGKNEAALILRHRLSAGGHVKVRWWVSKRSGIWKVYDVEMIEGGVRLSTLAAAGSDQPRGQEIARTMSHVGDAQAAIARENADEGERLLQMDAGVNLPNPLEGVRLATIGLLRKQRRQDREALTAMDEAGKLNPDFPYLDFVRGMLHARLDEDAAALEDYQAYRAVVGDDPFLSYETAEALRSLRRFGEANALYRSALNENPRLAGAFVGLCRSLNSGVGTRDDLADRLTRIDNPRETFNLLAEECREASNGETLEALARGMQQLHPNDASADYYLALAKTWVGETDDALTLFRSAVGKERNAETRETYTNRFLQAMARAGDPVPAYALATDPRSAFRLMADELKQVYRQGAMQMLVAAHTRRSPNDPVLRFYRAEQLLQQEKFAEADQAFGEAVEKVRDADVAESFRGSRVLARFRAGKAMSAYQEIGPRRETFTQLTYLLEEKPDAALLQALIDAHGKAEPDDPTLLKARFEVKIQQKDFTGAVVAFKTALAKEGNDDEKRMLVSGFLFRMQAAGKAVQAYRAAPDPDQAFGILTDGMEDGAQGEELGRLIEAHRERRPEDPRLALVAAERFIKQEAWAKAAAVLKPWLHKAPEDLADRFQYRYVFVRCKSGQGLQAYEDAPNRDTALNQVANFLLNEKKGRDAEMLVARHVLAAPEVDPNTLVLSMRAKVLCGKWGEAAAFLRQACELQKQEGSRHYYISQYVRAMAEQGKGLEAYRQSPDAGIAFSTLAADLVRQKKDADLKTLLDEHGARHPQDSGFHHYRGEWHLLRNDPAAAVPEFAQAVASAGYQKRYWRSGWQRALIRAGKIVDAYENSGSRNLALEQLAQECVTARDARQLAELLAKHREKSPDDPRLPEWEAEIPWLKGDYVAALDYMTKHRAELLLGQHYRWNLDERRIRCLIRLKRIDEAVREADALEKTRFVRTIQIVVHAARGDVKQTLALMEKIKDLTYLLSECYHDEDLGPILNTDAFKPVREKYPLPKDFERFDDD